jgi:hypothetical protein
MSVTSRMETLDPLTRVALLVYPRTWRERYGDEVIDTLLQVSPKSQRAEALHLGARGLWLRARSSVPFWGGLVILSLMLWAGMQAANGFTVERYWPALLTYAGASLPLTLPLAGAIAAWQGHAAARREAQSSTSRDRLLQAARKLWPVLAPLVLGYLAVLVTTVSTSGLPAAASPEAMLVPLSLFGLAVTACSFGYILGTVLHAGLAVPAAGVLLYAWYRMPEPVGGSVLAWRHVTGFNLSDCCLWVDVAPNPTSQVIALASGAIAVWLLALLVWIRPGWRRAVAVTAAALALATVLAVVAPTVPRLGEAGWVPRDAAALVCSGAAPQVCLWPEQSAERHTELDALFRTAYAKGVDAGLPMRPAVTPVLAHLSRSLDTRSNINEVHVPLNSTVDQVLANYGDAVYRASGCAIAPSSDESYERELGVEYAIAVILGANADAALPHLEHSAEARLPAIAYSAAEVRDLIGVHDEQEARAVVSEWLGGCDA